MSQTYDEARAAIQARPCRCVSCGTCRGSGRMWRNVAGAWPDEESMTCIDCDGDGLTEVCDRCAELSELDEACGDY